MPNQDSIVSIIMPTYRQSQYLRTSILSILAQTYPKVELVIVSVKDDEETDTVIQKLQTIMDIKHVISEKADHIHQINLGLKEAKGEFVTLFASDDFMLPNKVDMELRVATATKAVLVYSRFFLADELLDIYLTPPLPEKFSYKLLTTRCFVGDNSLVAKSMYDEFGLFDETLGSLAVYDKWLHIAEKYEDKIVFNPVPTFIYRTHPQQKHVERLADPKQMEVYERIVKASLQRKGLPTDGVKFRVKQIEYERV